MSQSTSAEFNEALARLRNAATPEEIRAAKARALTLGATAALKVDSKDREKFVAKLNNEIEKAYRKAQGRNKS